MTRDRARKKAVRARMAASGEPYSVSARNTAGAEPDSEMSAAEAIIACATRTLAEPSARIEVRTDWEFPPRPAQPAQRAPGLVGQLARRALKAGWERVADGVDLATMRDTFSHQVSVGYFEPAANRYQMNTDAYAEMRFDGKSFGGVPGVALQRRNQRRNSTEQANEPTGLLKLLLNVTDARYAGEETLRGTTCRVALARVGSAGLSVWTDGKHVRKVRAEDRAPGGTAKTSTLELWDFGVPVDSLDWSHLPSFGDVLVNRGAR